MSLARVSGRLGRHPVGYPTSMGHAGHTGHAGRDRGRRRLPDVHGISLLVLLVTLVLSALAALGARMSAADTEQRLLKDRTDSAGALLRAAVLSVQTPLASATELVESADGDPMAFTSFLEESVGDPSTSERPPFISAALFPVDGTAPIATLGAPTTLEASGAAPVRAMIERTIVTPGLLTVVDVLELGGRRIGYAWSSTSGTPRFVVYAEAALPEEPTAVPRAPGPYEDLHFALYLGSSERMDGLLYSSTPDLPLEGRTARTVVPFGDDELLLVMRSTEPMAGRLAQLLPWVIAGAGILLGVGLMALVERLLRERDGANGLATQIGFLYADQRRIADTLQRSLLPPRLPTPPGLTVVSRYWPASDDTTVGGDFYDVFQIDDERWGLVIGDVCGKGVDAAALTALTRHTMRAAARHTTSPTKVLQWAHEAIETAHGGATFATACMAVVSPAGAASHGMVLELALGGHERPLLCRADGTVEAIGEYGSLLGVVDPVFHETVHHLRVGDRLLLFTDGVTDAPGDAGITVEELTAALSGRPLDGPAGLADAVRLLVEQRRPDGLTDDTALLVVAVEPPADLGSSQWSERDDDLAEAGVAAGARSVDPGGTNGRAFAPCPAVSSSAEVGTPGAPGRARRHPARPLGSGGQAAQAAQAGRAGRTDGRGT